MNKEFEDATSDDINWNAVSLGAQYEISVTERLSKSRMKAFVPFVEKRGNWKDRKKRIAFPPFHGYLFVRFRNRSVEKLAVLKTPRMVHFMGHSPAEHEVVPGDQVFSLKRLVENKEAPDHYSYLKEGKKVRIKNGPLARQRQHKSTGQGFLSLCSRLTSRSRGSRFR